MKRLAILMSVVWAAWSQSPLTAQVELPGIGSRIDALFAEWDTVGSPGAAVAVIRNGELIHSKGYGTAQLEYQIPITPATVFHVASVSKQFTAMAVVLLADEGHFDLDDEVRDYVTDVPDFGTPVTIRQLLNHTSGIRDQWELLVMAGWRLDDVITTDDIMTMLRHQRELNFEPNSEYLYSNMGYTVLAQLVERVSARSFPEFARTRIFEPLGMRHTHVHDDHQMVVPNRAYSYSQSGDTVSKSVLSYANAGATSLFTTAEDLALWLDNFRHARVGGPAAVARLQEQGILNNGEELSYALGVIVGEYRGQRTIGHGGADAGFRSNVMWFPDQNVGIAVLSNSASFNVGQMARRVADIVLEDVLAPVEADQARDNDPMRRAVPVAHEVFDQYVGKFRMSVGGVIIFDRDGDRYRGRFAGTTFELVPLSQREFFVRERPSQVVTFHTAEDGSVDSLTLLQDGEPVGYGTRLADVAERNLADYTGRYYSPELDAFYEVVVVGNGLVARQRRHGDLPLTAVAEDEFAGSPWFFRSVRFERNAAGAVIGFRLTGGRVRNLRFERSR